MSYSRNLTADLAWNEQSQSYVLAPSRIYTSYVELHDNTYYNCQTITHVDAANTPWVNNSMFGAFENCSNLQSVTNINSNVTNMQATFMNCPKLAATPILPPSVTTMNSIFYGCSNILTMPDIPASVTNMNYAFMYCNKLSSVTTIPSGVNDLNYAFAYTNINTSPTLPLNVTGLMYTYAFCKNLNSAPIIPSNVSTLEGTFQGCQKIQSAPTIPNSVYDLSYTFSGCHNLHTAPEISNNVLYINETFKDCYKLTGDIIIRTPNIVHNITAINTFDNTSLRKNVYIPPYYYNDTTTHSETYNAFIEAGYDNKGTKDGVYLCYNYAPALPSDWITSIAANGTTVLEQYIGANTIVVTPHTDWYSNKVLNEASYSDGPFQNNKNITSVDLANVDVINNSLYKCFDSCSNLKSVANINQNVTNLESTFRFCQQLTKIPTIPQSVTSLASAFIGCNNITTANINVPVCINISNAFDNCSNLTNVNIIAPNATNISNLFNQCSKLTNVVLDCPNATNLYGTFNGCESLTTPPVLPPNTVDLMQTFRGCYNLTSFPTIPTSVTRMYDTFAYCWSVVDPPVLPPNIAQISGCFQCCYNLTTTPVIPSNVVDIQYAFHACRNITTTPIIPDRVYTGISAFYYCQNLTTLPNIGTNMQWMYKMCRDCVNMTGNMYIQSNKIINVTDCFQNTYLTKNIYIPFEYANGVNTVTRNTFEAAYPVNTISGTTVGTLTNNDGVVSGFSTNSYITSNLSNTYQAGDIDNFEISMKVTTPSSWTSNGRIINWNGGADSTLGPYIEAMQSGIYLCFYNGSYKNAYALSTPSSNTTYFIKFVYDGNSIKGYYKLNAEDSWILTAETAFAKTEVYFKTADFTVGGGAFDKNAVCVWNGLIDLKECYVKVNGQKVWNGYVRPNGVVLKDIDGSKITINPTPADATVSMYNETTGTEIDEEALNKFSYINVDGNIEIQALNTTDTVIVVPSMWTETKSMRAIDGNKIHYKVSKDGYNTIESEITVDGSQTINVNLKQIMCTFTVVPLPNDATVTLTTTISDPLYAWTATTCVPDTFSSLWVGKTIYTKIIPEIGENTRTCNLDGTYTIEGILTRTSETEFTTGGFGFTVTGIRDSIKDTTAQTYPQEGNSITVPWGTAVSYTVSKEHYTTVTGTEIVKTTGNKYIPLVIDKYTFTINPTPADAAVQILVNGKLANASASDWVFTADNLNGDIELQEYTGSNTAVVIPTSYETTNTVTADYSSTIEWKVSKDGHKTQTNILTLEQDTVLNIDLGNSLDVTDYTYTHNDGIVTLTGYIGNGGDIDTPEIEDI